MITDAIQVGEPVEHRGIVIAPLFPRRDPVARYLTLDLALERGLRIEETGAGGSVPELRVVNPLEERVLLYDGEELEDAFPLEDGQCGAVLALGDTLCLDLVSRPDGFAQLWPKLRAATCSTRSSGSTARRQRRRR